MQYKDDIFTLKDLPFEVQSLSLIEAGSYSFIFESEKDDTVIVYSFEDFKFPYLKVLERKSRIDLKLKFLKSISNHDDRESFVFEMARLYEAKEFIDGNLNMLFDCENSIYEWIRDWQPAKINDLDIILGSLEKLSDNTLAKASSCAISALRHITTDRESFCIDFHIFQFMFTKDKELIICDIGRK